MPTTPHRLKISAGHCAVVLAAAALFVALDGPSQAAGLITGKQIKNSSVTGKDIKDSSLQGADVQDDSVTGADVVESSLTKVQSAALADSVLPNAINGASVADTSLSLSDYAVARGTTTIDFSNILANSCLTDLIDTNSGSLAGALWTVTLNDTITTFANEGLTFHTSASTVTGNIRVNACNVTTAAKNPGPAAFQWAVFR